MSIQERIQSLPVDVRQLYKLTQDDLPHIRSYNPRMEAKLMDWFQQILSGRSFVHLVGQPMSPSERTDLIQIVLKCSETLLHMMVQEVCLGLINTRVLQCIGVACLASSFIFPTAHDFRTSVKEIVDYLCYLSDGGCTSQSVHRIMTDILIRTDWQLCKADMGIDRVYAMEEPEESTEEKVEMIRNIKSMIQEASRDERQNQKMMDEYLAYQRMKRRAPRIVSIPDSVEWSGRRKHARSKRHSKK